MTKDTNPVFAKQGTTIFTVMSALAVAHDAINLGQGFPDTDGPEFVRARAAHHLMTGPNQYPPMMGLPELRQAVAENGERFFGLSVDWQTQVLVTSGATEALADCLLALLEPGDEAILIEPFYDSYLPIVEAAGATARLVALTPPDWTLPLDDLAAAFTPKTKLLVLNSPMNPTGKLFSHAELSAIADLLTAHDAYAVCDEVYEHLVFDGQKHLPLMTLPGMAERVVRIGSAGKTFSLTGWKVGYVTGPAPMIEVIAKTHQFVTFTTVPALQLAVAEGLRAEAAYFHGLAQDLQEKRDLLSAGLAQVGFDVLPSKGTYFLTVDIRPLGLGLTDMAFCRRITEEARVAAVPCSAFYHPNSQPPEHLVRFCFCKEKPVLEDALERLAKYFG